MRNIPAIAAILAKYKDEIPPGLVSDIANYFATQSPNFDAKKFIRSVYNRRSTPRK